MCCNHDVVPDAVVSNPFLGCDVNILVQILQFIEAHWTIPVLGLGTKLLAEPESSLGTMLRICLAP